jgi:hypothetical protein
MNCWERVGLEVVQRRREARGNVNQKQQACGAPERFGLHQRSELSFCVDPRLGVCMGYRRFLEHEPGEGHYGQRDHSAGNGRESEGARGEKSAERSADERAGVHDNVARRIEAAGGALAVADLDDEAADHGAANHQHAVDRDHGDQDGYVGAGHNSDDEIQRARDDGAENQVVFAARAEQRDAIREDPGQRLEVPGQSAESEK